MSRHSTTDDAGPRTADWRLALPGLQAEAEDAGRDRAASAFRRLGLLAEVADCLLESAPAEAAGVSDFCAAGFGKLTGVDADEASDRIVRESDGRWGEYLTLIDPGSDRPSSSEGPTVPEVFGWDDTPSAIDSDTLVRLLTGDAPLPPRDPKTTAPDPFHLLGIVREPAGPPDDGDDDLEPPASLAIDPELRDTFLAEGADLFERLESLVLGLDQGGGCADPLHELGRCLHTLKGAAGSVDLTALVAVIHATEGRIEAAHGSDPGALIDRLHKLLRYIEGVFEALKRGGPARAEAPAPAPPPVPRPEPARPRPAAPAIPAAKPEPPQAAGQAAGSEGPVRVSAERLDELMDLVSELIMRRGLWAAQADAMKEFAALARACRTRMTGTIDRIRDAGPAPAPRGGFQGAADLSELTRRLAEQSEDLAVLAESAEAAGQPLADNADSLARLTLQLWEALQAIRIVPVRGLFQRLARVAHEAARVEGRHVEVLTKGEETGLDRAAQDKAFEPLLHVVRNAVSHGIESAGDRAAAGKPAVGIITLQAARAGPTLILSVCDDGRGIDYEAVAAKGKRIGLLDPDERPGVDRLNALIFQPGFSTRDEANAIAGRGVGMDVVSQEAARMHGTVALASQRGQGTRLSLSFPARLALEQSIVLRVDGRAFALPLDLTELAQPFDPAELDLSGPCPTILMRDERVPLIALREALGVTSGLAVASPKVLLIRAEGEPLAVLVDAIDGTRELVIKPLGALLAGHPLVSGTSLSVNGEVVFALDPAGLARWFREGFGEGGVVASLVGAPKAAPVLVVDDSISVRKVVVRKLRAEGYEVDEASDGLEALGKVRNNAYSLVVSDLEMPRMDGFELLAELSRLTIASSVPVIVASAKSDPETRRRVLALGAREFLPKPIVPEELAARVRAHIQGTAAPASRSESA